MTFHSHILPRENATPLEIALDEKLEARVLDISVPIRDLWRWDSCPVEFLPWLAWTMSVDLWDPSWPVEKKRAIIRDSLALHRRKGTLWAIERYLTIAGTPLRRAIVPPDKPFLGRAMTDDERQSWLTRFPQIRIHQFRDRGTASYGAFVSGGAFKRSKTFLGGGVFPYQTDAWQRYGRRAFLWDQGTHYLASGTETPLRWIERTRVEKQQTVYDYERVLVPGKQPGLFAGAMTLGNAGRHDGKIFPIASAANSRIVSVRLERAASIKEDVLNKFALRPSLAPINAFAEKVAERGTASLAAQMFCGIPGGQWVDLAAKTRHRVKSFIGGYLPATTAPERLYDRLYLHDKARLPDERPRALHMGHFRLGMPDFHARLNVNVAGRRAVTQFDRYIYGFFCAAEQSKLALARRAINQSKSFRDKIAMKTAHHRTIRTSDGITAGSDLRSGDLVTIH